MTPLYAGIGGVVRELTEMDAGINGVVTPLTEMWAGVGGVQRQIFSAVKNQTWQKWSADSKIGYSSSSAKTDLAYVRPPNDEIKTVYYYNGTKYRLPQITTNTFDSRPSSATTLWTSKFSSVSLEIRAPIENIGWYILVPDTQSLTTCAPIYLDVGYTLTETLVSTAYIRFMISTSTPVRRITEKTVKVKGTTNYGTVIAPEGTYPSNGYQDGYWWVLVG